MFLSFEYIFDIRTGQTLNPSHHRHAFLIVKVVGLLELVFCLNAHVKSQQENLSLTVDLMSHETQDTYCIYLQGLAIKQGILPELDKEDLELTKVIGRGAYGDVYEGVLRDRETGKDHNVAIKSLKS